MSVKQANKFLNSINKSKKLLIKIQKEYTVLMKKIAYEEGFDVSTDDLKFAANNNININKNYKYNLKNIRLNLSLN